MVYPLPLLPHLYPLSSPLPFHLPSHPHSSPLPLLLLPLSFSLAFPFHPLCSIASSVSFPFLPFLCIFILIFLPSPFFSHVNHGGTGRDFLPQSLSFRGTLLGLAS